MASERVLRRLLKLRELEEEQGRLRLELAAKERDKAGAEMRAVLNEQNLGRGNFSVGVRDLDSAGRTGGLLEAEQARRRRAWMEPRMVAAEEEVVRQRTEFLNKRSGRMQVETLADDARAAAAVETERRAQQMLDDWYGRRLQAAFRRPTPLPVIEHGQKFGDSSNLKLAKAQLQRKRIGIVL